MICPNCGNDNPMMITSNDEFDYDIADVLVTFNTVRTGVCINKGFQCMKCSQTWFTGEADV